MTFYTVKLLILVVWLSVFCSCQHIDLSNVEVVGNDLIDRPNPEDSNPTQTVIDPNLNISKPGYLIGWRFYAPRRLGKLPDDNRMSLEIWSCNESDPCGSTEKHVTMLAMHHSIMGINVTVPLVRPVRVETNDCVGYSTRGGHPDHVGVIPYNIESIPQYKIQCFIDRSKNVALPQRQPRLYSIQALIVDNVPEEKADYKRTFHCYNHKHNIGSGYNMQQVKTASQFLCATRCKEVNCVSFTFDKDKRICKTSDDTSFKYSNWYQE